MFSAEKSVDSNVGMQYGFRVSEMTPKEVFMFSKFMEIVSTVAGKGANPPVAD